MPKASIFIVDDVASILELLRLVLKKEGYEVQTAPEAQRALDMALVNPPDLFLVDILLPGINGYEFCNELQYHEELAAIPVIFISAQDRPYDKQKAFEVGAVDFVVKPIDIEELLEKIDFHLHS